MILNYQTAHNSRGLFGNKMIQYTVIVLTAALFGYVTARGCPPEHLTRPCKCTFENLREILRCENITDRSILDGVMRRTAGFPFNEFNLVNSKIDFIPLEHLQQKLFMRIIIEDSQMTAVSDNASGVSYSLKFLRFANVNFSRGLPWNQLRAFPNLQQLIFSRVNIPSIGQDFKNNVGKNLRHIALNDTNTKHIDDGAFSQHSRLESIGIQNSALKILKRSFFPRPASILLLRFNGNELETLPEDIFEGMPRLRMIEFNRNKLSTISEAVFQKIPHKLVYVRLEDNPMNCNCSLRWILTLTSRTSVFGTCANPGSLSGKSLKDLAENDFRSCS